MHPSAEPQSSVQVEEILYVLFRHKWLILIFSLGGLAAAIFIYCTHVTPYCSEAKLLVRYITDSAALNPSTSEGSRQIKFTDVRGDTIIDSEIEILTSWDLIEDVVEAIGARKIIAEPPGAQNAKGNGTDRKAVRAIQKSLAVDVPRRSSVITLQYENPNPKVAQEVLRELVQRYLQKHVEIHRAVGAYDFLQQQTDQLRARLMQTEEELRKLKSDAGIISLEESEQSVSAQLKTVQDDLYQAETDLTQRKARVEKIESWLTTEGTTPGSSPAESGATADQNDYRSIVERLRLLREKELDLLSQFTQQSIPVTQVRRQIADLEKRKSELEEKGSITALTVVSPGLDTKGTRALNMMEEKAQLVALQARIKTLNDRLEKLRKEAVRLDSVKNAIVQLQRQKDLEEEKYRYFSQNLEQARIDVALDSAKISNISIVQTPSVALKSPSGLKKKLLTALFGGLFGGIGFAFLIEYLGVRTVKRPAEVKSKLGLPLVLTVAYKRAKRRWKSKIWIWPSKSEEPRPTPVMVEHRFLNPCEQLRDRLLTTFNGAPKRPRLVGLTSCSPKSGVTTLAAGLATTLSEEVDGWVLFVRVTSEKVWATIYRNGCPVDYFPQSKEGQPQHLLPFHEEPEPSILGNSDGFENASGRHLARTFLELISRLRCSDYDYVVFDLPPTTESALAGRLTPYMDKLLLVIEAQKTPFDTARNAAAILQEANADVGVVLNKKCKYVPGWLSPEM